MMEYTQLGKAGMKVSPVCLGTMTFGREANEKSSFESLFSKGELPEAFQYLIQAENVLLSPHVAGWSKESKVKLAQTVLNKISSRFS